MPISPKVPRVPKLPTAPKEVSLPSTFSQNPAPENPLLGTYQGGQTKVTRENASGLLLAPFSQPLRTLSEVEGERDVFYRRLIPVNTSTVGRSIKLRKLFTVSGAVASDSTVTTVTASVVSTTETDLASFRFFKDEFHRGMLVRITALGTYTSDGTRTVTLKIGSGLAPTTEWNSFASTAASTTNAPWNLTWYGIIGTIGASGTVEGQLTGRINNVNKDDGNSATVSFDTTQTNTVALTATWSANNSGNSISIRQWIVEVLK